MHKLLLLRLLLLMLLLAIRLLVWQLLFKFLLLHWEALLLSLWRLRQMLARRGLPSIVAKLIISISDGASLPSARIMRRAIVLTRFTAVRDCCHVRWYFAIALPEEDWPEEIYGVVDTAGGVMFPVVLVALNQRWADDNKLVRLEAAHPLPRISCGKSVCNCNAGEVDEAVSKICGTASINWQIEEVDALPDLKASLMQLLQE